MYGDVVERTYAYVVPVDADQLHLWFQNQVQLTTAKRQPGVLGLFPSGKYYRILGNGMAGDGTLDVTLTTDQQANYQRLRAQTQVAFAIFHYLV
jgi:hypothetical protein